MRETPDAGHEIVRTGHLSDASSEDLAENARRARARAPALCRAAPGRDACDWYHGFYPLLRLVGAAATPDRHAGFYARTLRSLVWQGGVESVLIPGAADSGMLRGVTSVLLDAGARPRIRVLDRCETPLSLCLDFARRCGEAVDTQVFDLLGGVSREATGPHFDVACTHSLLAFFPPERRREGIQACRAWLRPGGKLVTTARLDRSASEAGTRFTGAGAHTFAARIRAAAACVPAVGLTPGAVFDRAYRYAENMVSWPYASKNELVSDLETSGFAIEHLAIVEVAGRLAPGVAGAGTHQHATYAEFVATRV
jgi:hypothetical protein